MHSTYLYTLYSGTHHAILRRPDAFLRVKLRSTDTLARCVARINGWLNRPSLSPQEDVSRGPFTTHLEATMDESAWSTHPPLIDAAVLAEVHPDED